MAAFAAAVQAMQSQVQEKNDEYVSMVQGCSDADHNASEFCAAAEQYAASDPCTELEQQAQEKQVECESDFGSAKVAICAFGTSLQGMYTDWEAVQSFIAKVKGENRTDSLSESDRQLEWEAVQRLSCLLEALRDEGDLSEEAATSCAANRTYPHTFDYLDEEIAALTSSLNFTWGDTLMTFSGYWWTVGSIASEFVRNDAHLTVSYTEGTAPFEICAESSSVPSGQVLVGPPMKPSKNHVAGQVECSKHVQFSVVVNPKGLVSGWGNVFMAHEEDSASAIDHLDTFALHFFDQSTRTRTWVNWHGLPHAYQEYCDVADPLPLNQDTTVVIRLAGGEVNVLYNGTVVCTNTNYGDDTGMGEGVMPVYTSSFAHTAADVVISNLVYTVLP
mmetsp:Transcript_62440/g.167146  ORF Transcript_62440/g.167146 Transcript_62440/m.167146 type:complete len:389 (-) Transcript_62440:403-1569(-)